MGISVYSFTLTVYLYFKPTFVTTNIFFRKSGRYLDTTNNLQDGRFDNYFSRV